MLPMEKTEKELLQLFSNLSEDKKLKVRKLINENHAASSPRNAAPSTRNGTPSPRNATPSPRNAATSTRNKRLRSEISLSPQSPNDTQSPRTNRGSKPRKRIDAVMLNHQFPESVTSNRVKLADEIEKIKPDATRISEVVITRGGKVLIFGEEYSDYGKLLKKDSWKKSEHGEVTPSVPIAKTIPQHVVLRGVDLNIPDEDIKEKIQEKGLNPLETKRLINASSGKPTYSVKVTLHSQEEKIKLLNNGLSAFYKHHRCEEYRMSLQALQCYKCQKFGHGQSQCKSPVEVCLRCGGNHRHTDCEVDKEHPKCANCQGNHPAHFRGCQVYKDAAKQQQNSQSDRYQTYASRAMVTPNPQLKQMLAVVTDALVNILDKVTPGKKVELNMVAQCIALSSQKIMKSDVTSESLMNIIDPEQVLTDVSKSEKETPSLGQNCAPK